MNLLVPLACAVGTGVGNMLIALCAKGAERRQLPPMVFSMGYQGMAGLVALTTVWGQALPCGDPRFWGLALAMGAGYAWALGTLVTANRQGPSSLVWTTGNLGLVVPIGLAALWLHERLVPLDGVVLTVFLLALALFALGMRGGARVEVAHPLRYGMALVQVFVSNGLLMFGYKLKDAWLGNMGTSGFLAVVFGSGAAFSLCTPAGRDLVRSWFGSSGAAGAEGRAGARAWAWALAGGALGGVAAQLMLRAMPLPAAVSFPLIQGVGLAGGVILTAVVFREQVNGWKLGGLAAALGVIVLAALR